MNDVQIRISKKLYEKIKERVKQSSGEFKSVEKYVEFVLWEVVREKPEQVYSPEEEREVKERLRSLGYL